MNEAERELEREGRRRQVAVGPHPDQRLPDVAHLVRADRQRVRHLDEREYPGSRACRRGIRRASARAARDDARVRRQRRRAAWDAVLAQVEVRVRRPHEVARERREVPETAHPVALRRRSGRRAPRRCRRPSDTRSCRPWVAAAAARERATAPRSAENCRRELRRSVRAAHLTAADPAAPFSCGTPRTLVANSRSWFSITAVPLTARATVIHALSSVVQSAQFTSAWTHSKMTSRIATCVENEPPKRRSSCVGAPRAPPAS